MRSAWVVAFILWGVGDKREVPSLYHKMKNPLKASRDVLQSGRDVYQRTCIFCHGETGKGDGEKMMVRKGRPIPDFTTGRFAKHSDQWIMWRISEGVPKTLMMAYKTELPEEDRWSLVLFLRSLNPKTAKAKK